MITFDSHCHPQMEQYDNDRDDMLRRALDADVSMICIGVDYETSKRGIELAQKHENIWATVGLHPNDVASSMQHVVWKDFENLVSQRRVVAIGEVGLDYYRTPELEKQEQQKEIFQQFLDLTVKYNKPVIIHSRDAAKGSSGRVHSDMLSILATYYRLHTTNLRGVAHSFTGDINDARKYLDLGFYLGFNGIITFPPSRKAMEGQAPGMYDEVVKYAPLDRILLETDAPFLSPEPYRGKRNEPVRVIEVAKKIAELRNESLDKVISQTTDSCKKLFGLV